MAATQATRAGAVAGAHTAPQRWAEAPDGGGRWWFSGATGAREGGGNAANRRQRAEEAWRRAKEDRRRHRVEEDRRRREAEERQWPAPRHREAARGMQPPTTSVGGLQTSGATLVGGFRTTLVGGRVPRVLRALERASLTCCPRRDAPGDPRHDVPAFGGRAGLRLGRRIGRGWARIRISSSGGTRSLPVTCASFPRRAARPAAGAWATLSTFSPPSFRPSALKAAHASMLSAMASSAACCAALPWGRHVSRPAASGPSTPPAVVVCQSEGPPGCVGARRGRRAPRRVDADGTEPHLA